MDNERIRIVSHRRGMRRGHPYYYARKKTDKKILFVPSRAIEMPRLSTHKSQNRINKFLIIFSSMQIEFFEKKS